jgi:predicted nucleic acid-binding protein
MYVFDTYAWVEYLSGAKNSSRVGEILESGEELYTPTIVIAEVKRKFLRELPKGRQGILADMLRFIKTKTLAIDLNCAIAEKAAEIADELSRERKGMGLADAVILATARSLGAKVVTGDEHFRSLKDVVFIKP